MGATYIVKNRTYNSVKEQNSKYYLQQRARKATLVAKGEEEGVLTKSQPSPPPVHPLSSKYHHIIIGTCGVFHPRLGAHNSRGE
jgi:hypothetical protein